MYLTFSNFKIKVRLHLQYNKTRLQTSTVTTHDSRPSRIPIIMAIPVLSLYKTVKFVSQFVVFLDITCYQKLYEFVVLVSPKARDFG